MKPASALTIKVREAIKEATWTKLPEYDAHNAAEADVMAVIEYITRRSA